MTDYLKLVGNVFHDPSVTASIRRKKFALRCLFLSSFLTSDSYRWTRVMSCKRGKL